MSKLKAAISSSITNIGGKIEEGDLGKEEVKYVEGVEDIVKYGDTAGEKNCKIEDDNKEILKFTMLFNKYNCDLDMKRSWRSYEGKRDNKWAMFFNKEVTIRPIAEVKNSNSAAKIQGLKKTGNHDKSVRQTLSSRGSKIKFHQNSQLIPEPQISELGLMFPCSLVSSPLDLLYGEPQSKVDSIKKFFYKRNLKTESYPFTQINVHPTAQKDLKSHNSLTNLPKNNKVGLREAENLKSKIPSLTALDTNTEQPKSGLAKLSYWDDFILFHNDIDKRLDLQITRSSNDNNRHNTMKFKKDDPASVSDSKLLDVDSESKKPIKKYDKKLRADSSKRERDIGNRKQVQWKTEVDVIYFSTNLAANGDRTREIIGRVMEPLREEWEQQRKGFYAKLVPSQMENHIGEWYNNKKFQTWKPKRRQ